jgi:Domain of unknown function (DUF4136)
MKKINLFLIVLISFIAGCFKPTPNVYQSETTKGIDFKKYKTYAWLATKDTAFTALISKKTLESALSKAVIEQLNKRGMVLDTLNPDCLFTYTLIMVKTYTYGDTPPDVVAPSSNVGMAPGQYNNFYYYVPSQNYNVNYDPTLYQGSMQVNTFRNGTLVIDMLDTKQDKIIWRSTAQGKVDERDRKGVKPTVNEVVPTMFKKFPVKKIN